MDTYNTIEKAGEGLYKEKGSKFLGFAYSVTTELEIKELLIQLHKDHHNSRHICYAYKLGYGSNAPYRINDDGEPSGTAGKPIYGQILSHKLTDILIVVVRYFGGTKLGVSGLINAYKSASSDAIQGTSIINVIRYTPISISYDFVLTNEVMRIVKDHHLKISDQSYDTGCHTTVSVRLSEYDRVKGIFEKIYGIDVHKEDK